MSKKIAIGGGIALGAVFCVLVVIAVILLFLRGPAEVLDIQEDPNLVQEGRLEDPGSSDVGTMTLEDARKKAAYALQDDPSICPHILGESLDIAFGTGISVEHDGNWYLRGRCSDDAYLVVVSPDEVDIKTCEAARDAGQSCQNSDWLSDSQP